MRSSGVTPSHPYETAEVYSIVLRGEPGPFTQMPELLGEPLMIITLLDDIVALTAFPHLHVYTCAGKPHTTPRYRFTFHVPFSTCPASYIVHSNNTV